MKNKKVLTLFACLGILGCSIGGSMAWLTTETKEVVNTFTVGDINIQISETDMEEVKDGSDNITGYAKDYTFVPGQTLLKDPKVTVKAGSEASYLFLRVQEDNNSITVDAETADPIIVWDVIEDGTNEWIPVTGHDGYWYREVEDLSTPGAVDASFWVLTPGADDGDASTLEQNGHVTISEDVTKAMVSGINAAAPTLTFTAAAVQKDNVADVAAAFAKLPAEFTN